jgi:hypothetical protein
MKIRNSLVSNSSSCSFIIYNKSDKQLTIVDFVKENPQLIEQFKNQYDFYKNDPKFTQENLILSAQMRLDEKPHTYDGISLYIIPPNSHHHLIFGDSHGDVIGHVFDYILRDGGESEHFRWEFDEMLR